MKSKSLLIILSLGIITVAYFNIMSCAEKSDEFKKTEPKTEPTAIVFVTPFEWQNLKLGFVGNQVISTIGYRLTKDTFAFDSINSTTLTKKWIRDTIYAVELHFPPKDTAKSKKDSVLYLYLPKKFVKDLNMNPNQQ